MLSLVHRGGRFLQKCGHALLHLAYPPLCLHCREVGSSHVFCNTCYLLLELINPLERCPFCFAFDDSQKCPECAQSIRICHRIAAAFDHTGPAASLVRAIKYGNCPYLAKGAAAFLAVQLLSLNWPLPDVIIPVPISPVRWLQRGYNQSFFLAKYLGKLIDRPVQQALRRVSGDYRQTGMSRDQRLQLSPHSFRLIRGKNLRDRSLLLVDDVMTTGSTLRCCAEVLWEAYPRVINGLTLCRGIQ